MNRKLKLIWNFHGEVALETAKHHCVHLEEFAKTESLDFYEVNTHQVHEMTAIAFIVIDEKDLAIYRDALKPHRGEIVEG